MAPTRMLTIATVARRLNCHISHVYRLIQEGRVEAFKIGTRALRVSEESLDRFIEAGRVDPDDYFA